MNEKVLAKIEDAARSAKEEGDLFVVSILYSVMGAYNLDGAREMAKEVNVFTQRAILKLAPDSPDQWPDSV